MIFGLIEIMFINFFLTIFWEFSKLKSLNYNKLKSCVRLKKVCSVFTEWLLYFTCIPYNLFQKQTNITRIKAWLRGQKLYCLKNHL